jgi:hypothetical protein
MTKHLTRLTLAIAVTSTLALPSPASAQSPWDGPMLLAPGSPAGLGIHLVDPSSGDGIGGLVTWRANPAPVGLGFRVGVVEGRFDDVAFTGGVDVSGTLYSGDDDVPFDVIWLAGAGVGVDDDVLLSFPLGVSAGFAFNGPEVQFRPYIAPRFVFDAFFGDGRRDGDGSPRRDDDLDLGFALEFGLDLAFGQPWAIRTAASVGDRDALSIGVNFPTN